MSRLISLSLVVLLGLTLVIPISSSLAAGTLKVTTPNGGQKWKVNNSYTVRWNTGGLGGKVRIRLQRQNKSRNKIFITDTPNDGVYIWSIASKINSGKYGFLKEI